MTYELPDGVGVTYGPATMESRPELAIKIAQVAHQWNHFEQNLQGFYAYLMGRYLPRVAGFEPPDHPVAFQVFDTLDLFRPKKELFEALLEWALQPHPNVMEEYRLNLSRPISTAAKARHRVVHSLWGTCDQYLDRLILVPTFGMRIVWKKSDFDEELKKITQVKSSLGQFEMKVRNLLG